MVKSLSTAQNGPKMPLRHAPHVAGVEQSAHVGLLRRLRPFELVADHVVVDGATTLRNTPNGVGRSGVGARPSGPLRACPQFGNARSVRPGV